MECAVKGLIIVLPEDVFQEITSSISTTMISKIRSKLWIYLLCSIPISSGNPTLICLYGPFFLIWKVPASLFWNSRSYFHAYTLAYKNSSRRQVMFDETSSKYTTSTVISKLPGVISVPNRRTSRISGIWKWMMSGFELSGYQHP